jgi:hypothetical protein
MAGSEAEERIREKAEAQLRREFPDARIIHELNMQWGGIRLDLAAVTPSTITLVEIKSERDVLKRLPAQVDAALKITGDVRVYAAERHRAGLIDAHNEHLRDAEGHTVVEWIEVKNGRYAKYEPNPAFVRRLDRCRVQIETDSGFEFCQSMHPSWWLRLVMDHVPEATALLELLWAEELRQMLCDACLGSPPRANRTLMKRLAIEDMTLRQIRRGVCAALRNRTFARADALDAQQESA